MTWRRFVDWLRRKPEPWNPTVEEWEACRAAFLKAAVSPRFKRMVDGGQSYRFFPALLHKKREKGQSAQKERRDSDDHQ